MRHYMVDPDNEERLLKIPPRVVAAIKSEALEAAREAVAALYDRHDASCNDPRCEGPDREFALAAIDALRGESNG